MVKRNGKLAYVSGSVWIFLQGERSEIRQIVQVRRHHQHDGQGQASARELLSSSSREEEEEEEEKRAALFFIVDHAPWYACALEWLEVDWIPMTFGVRNYIERWYRTFKERTKRFYNNNF